MRSYYIIIVFLFTNIIFAQDISPIGKLKANVVRTANIVDGAVDSLKIKDSAVTWNKLSQLAKDSIAANISVSDSSITSAKTAGFKVADTTVLKALTGKSDGDIVYMEEISSGAGVGTGDFVYKSNGYTANKVTVFDASGGGYWVRKGSETGIVNVEWAGAIKDDANSDHVAFNNAIDALSDGGTLIIPKGTYILNDPAYPTIRSKNNITIQANGSTLKSNSSRPTLLFVNSENINYASESKFWFTGFDYAEFIDINGSEIKRDSSYIAIADSNDWKNLSWWRDDMLIEIGGDSTYDNVYWEGTLFEFSHFGTVGGNQVMYSKRPFIRNMEIASNDDLYLNTDSSKYWIQAIPLYKNLTINNLNIENGRIEINGYKNVFITNFTAKLDDYYAETVRSAIDFNAVVSVFCNNIIGSNYHKTGVGYVLHPQTFIDVTIDGGYFEDNRHGITTGTTYHSYSRGLYCTNLNFIQTPNYTGSYGAFDTHGNADDIYLSNSRFVDIVGVPISLRNSGIIVDNVTVNNCPTFINFSQHEPFPAKKIVVKNSYLTDSYGNMIKSNAGSRLSYLEIDNNTLIKGSNQNTGSSTGFLFLNDSSYVDTIIIKDNKYIGNNYVSNCHLVWFAETGYEEKDWLTTKYLEIKNNTALLFNGVIYATLYNGIGEISIVNNNFKDFNQILTMSSVNRAGTSVTDTTNTGVNYIYMSYNKFKNFYRKFSFTKMRVDTLESQINDYNMFAATDLNQTVVYKRMDYLRDEFKNPWCVSTTNSDFLNAFVKNEINITECKFYNPDSALFELVKTQRSVVSGLTAYGTFNRRLSIGRRQVSNYVADIKFNKNEWYLEPASTQRFFQSDTGNVEMIGNTIKFPKNLTGTIYPIYVSDPGPFVFRDNYMQANSDKFSYHIYIGANQGARDSIAVFNNTFIDNSAVPFATSRPVYCNTTNLNALVGNNKVHGFKYNSTFGTTPTITPIYTEWLFMRRDADNTIYKIVPGDTMTTTTY